LTAVAAFVGYFLGSIPTAGFLGRLWGHNLRAEGSGNPGTKNALATGGPYLAVSVLLIEAAKGYLAVWVGGLIADDAGMVAAGVGAVAGNVFNVWYRFSGGKGLGISLGVLAAVWPNVLVVCITVIVVALLVTRSAGLASLAAMAGLLLSSVLWYVNEWPTGGVEPNAQLFVISIGLTAIMGWKHWRDSPLNSRWRSSHPTPA
jgi:glycerol-3-phosphate acyltransferase PlsY